MPILELIVADFDREVAHSRKILNALPADKLGWKPHEKSMTLGQLAGHLAETPTWVAGMMEDELDFATLEADWKPFVPETLDELLGAFEKNAALFAQSLAGKDDAFFQATYTMRKGADVLRVAPRQDVMRDIMLHHVAHHRGQLTVYLRLLDVAVPSTYGPTADDSSF